MLSLKYTDISSNVTIDGQKISLLLENNDLMPLSKIPSFIHVAGNTSVGVPENFGAIRISQMTKHPPYETYRDRIAVSNPANIKPWEIIVEPVQFALSQIKEKIIVKETELIRSNINSKMALAVLTWLYNRRCDLECSIAKALVLASKNTQDKIVKNTGDEKATDFANGAHFVTETIATPEQAEDSFSAASDVIVQIGLECASTGYDRDNRFVTGINREDVLCICSPVFLRKLTSRVGLVSSPQGYQEIFKKMDIKRALGFDVLAARNLPRGINFIFITTGTCGTFAYNTAVQGAETTTGDSPDCEYDKIAYLSHSYIAGIVNESLVVASVNDEFVMPSDYAEIPLISKTIYREPQSYAEIEKS